MATYNDIKKIKIGDNVFVIHVPTASEVGALPSSTTIPTKTSQLTNDSGFLTSHLTGRGAIDVGNNQISLKIDAKPVAGIYKHTVNNISGLALVLDDGSADGEALFIPDGDGFYAGSQAIINQIPTKTSQLTNDSGFITGNVGGVFYGTCSTAAGTVAKVVECADFTADNLKAGAIIIVTFTATNSGAVASLTMNVNSTGAKPIKYINNGTLGNLVSAGYLKANTEYPFYYDGANWVVWFNYNTTYSAMTESEMHTGTATSARTITAQRLKQAVEYHAPVTSVNGSTGDVTVTVPTKTSDLTNDNEFVTQTELEEAIDNIPSGGGGGSAPTLLGQTPYKLTEDTNVKLTASGNCNYTLQSDTVADFDILNGTKNNVTVYQEDGVFKIKATTGATAWYQAYVDIYVDGLTVGTTYTLVFDAVGCTQNDSAHITVGHYILYDNSGETLITRNTTDGAKLHARSFNATTTRVKLRWYPATNNTFSSGNSIGNVNCIYIDVSGASDHTDIVSSSGSFTDSVEIGQVAKGVTISASPTASVYKMPASSGEASLPLEGKNIVVFGDSLIGMYRGDTSATTYLATATGATVYNVGFGGCRMSTHPSHGYAEFSMWALADAVATGTWTSQDAYASSGSDYFPEQLATLKSIDFNTIDYVIIHYGTNDFGGGVAIGASSASTDHSTLCGAARYSIEKLLTAYPKLRIFISLPVYRYWEVDGTITYAETYTNSQNNKLYECVDALRNVAKEYNLPIIDGYYGLGINKMNASTFLLDGTHHNAVGRERFGRFMGSEIVASIAATDTKYSAGTLLWTNSSPTSSFTAKTVSLDLSEYSAIEIEFKHASSSNSFLYQKCKIPSDDMSLFYMTGKGTYFELESRAVTVTTSGVTFADGRRAQATWTASSDNIRCVPTRIFGIK